MTVKKTLYFSGNRNVTAVPRFKLRLYILRPGSTFYVPAVQNRIAGNAGSYSIGPNNALSILNVPARLVHAIEPQHALPLTAVRVGREKMQSQFLVASVAMPWYSSSSGLFHTKIPVTLSIYFIFFFCETL
jgi:hypothetical protein